MRFVHTSDWHLGRLFHGVHLTDDQAHVLDQLVALCREVRPHAVLIAGDIYDRAVPPPEAVALLDDVLARLVLDLGVRVIAIAGNHDSPDRLGFCARVLAERGLHVAGRATGAPQAIRIDDEHGAVSILPIPYAEPAMTRTLLAADEITEHDAAMSALVELGRATLPAGERSVVLAHAFVTGGDPCDSERPLSLGGTGTVGAARFAGFHYGALGHLHRPQRVGANALEYSGSLLKYSFSEAAHTKSVSVVDMDAGGVCRIERVSLSPRRDVRVVRGSLADLLAGPRSGESREDYILAMLTDTGALLDAMGRMREVYPNCLAIDRSAFFAARAPAENGGARVDHRVQTELELFEAFFAEVTGASASADEARVFTDVVAALARRSRESAR